MKKRTLPLFLALILTLGLAAPALAAGNPFTDVSKDQFFYDAVLWAYENGVTTGTTKTTFSPNGTCTRGQVVTFLYRALGEPEYTGTVNPFTDVKEKDYYYDAVLWAVENGVTTGTTKTTFSPNETCTDAQVLTFLWRAMGKPEANAAGTAAEGLKDSTFYKTAVAWAERGGLFTYYGSVFHPNDQAKRAFIVYYLYVLRDQLAGQSKAAARTVPDLMAYLGASSFETKVYGNYTACEAKFNTVSDSSFSIIQGFFDLIDSHGYQLKLVDETKQQNSSGDRWYRWYQYVGPQAEGVGVTSAGTSYNFCVLYSNTKGYADPASNRCSITVCVGTGLTQVDTGERVKRTLTPFTPAAAPTPTPTLKPTPTPTPTPTPKPTPTPTPTTGTTTRTEPYLVAQKCTSCTNGVNKQTCWRCNGSGIQKGWTSSCSGCNGTGALNIVCKQCGGDGKLDKGDPGFVGMVWDIPPGYVGKCPFCDATGRIKCICDNGTVKRWNGITKKYDYSTCTVKGCNKGWISCDGCSGDGRIDLNDPHDKQ